MQDDRFAGAGPSDPIIITGRFRSGTTVLWHLLRDLPGIRAYFEPLHDNLLDHMAAGLPPDPTHRGVEEYFAEYRDCEALLTDHHRSHFGVERLCLAAGEEHPEIERYLRLLVEAASPGRALFKLVRADYRLPWLRARFASAPIIAIRRNPRDNWASIVRNEPADRRFAAGVNTGYDLLIAAAELLPHLPALANLSFETSYEQSYYLWRVSNAVADRYADLVVDLDQELSKDAAGALARIAETAGLDIDGARIETLAAGVIPSGRDASADIGAAVPFAEIERHCDRMLDESGLLAEIAQEGLSGRRWPLHARGALRVRSRLTAPLGRTVSAHRSVILQTQCALADARRQLDGDAGARAAQAEEGDAFVRSLRTELAKREEVAGQLQRALERERAAATDEIARRDESLSAAHRHAADLDAELTKVQAAAAEQMGVARESVAEAGRMVEGLETELARREQYAGELAHELEKLHRDSVREISSRDETVAAAARHVEGLTAELERREDYVRSLDAELNRQRSAAEADVGRRAEAFAAAEAYARDLLAALERHAEHARALEAELVRVQIEAPSAETAVPRLSETLRRLAEAASGPTGAASGSAPATGELDKRDVVNAALHHTIQRLRGAFSEERSQRDLHLAEAQRFARSLLDEREELTRHAQAQLAAHEKAAGEAKTYVKALEAEVAKLERHAKQEIDARDREVAELRVALDRVTRDAEREIRARDEAMVAKDAYTQSLLERFGTAERDLPPDDDDGTTRRQASDHGAHAVDERKP